ncbi:MAG: recombinase RecB [Desulfurococcaceae archaeon]
MSSGAGLSARRRWIASEKIALGVLEELGYRIIETGKRIEINGVEVGEVDILATDSEGKTYAVEVKAGRIDVGGIRQAYVNAFLLGSIPMVICKGFADDAAKELAEKLGVKVIQLSDVFLVESEEIYTIMREVIEETLTDYLEVFYGYSPQMKPEQLDVLLVIYNSTSIDEAASKLGVDVATLARRIDDLKKQGVLPKWATKYNTVKRVAQLLLQKQSVISALEESRKLLEIIKSFEEQFKVLQGSVQAVNQQIRRLNEIITKLESKLSQLDLKQTHGINSGANSN